MLNTLRQALTTFMREVPLKTKKGPHIRDGMDLKRLMILVVFALVPCVLMAIWNTGLQKFVYASGDSALMNDYLTAPYFEFAFRQGHFLEILKLGLYAFLPVMIVSYAIGGFWECLFASIRGHEISEGFLVSGILFALILPPTIPYWMVAVGVSLGIVIGKEVFGGSGMNILNPAMLCRCFLFFAFPTKMTGDVWVGTNPTVVRESLLAMDVDGVTQTTPLGILNMSSDIKRIHVDTLAFVNGYSKDNQKTLEAALKKYDSTLTLSTLTPSETQAFVTAPFTQSGLGLSLDNFTTAGEFVKLKYGDAHYTNENFFFGNMLGSMGETSTFACLLGALLLIGVGIGSWRTMLAVALGAFCCALLFQYGSKFSLWFPAKFDFPAYKHLLLGGLAFGLVFMATDPVSSPGLNLGKWIYGLIIGTFVIVIRLINPAFPEGVMLAVLFGNVFAPLIDHLTLKRLRRGRLARS
ncbi:MAG: Na(+)-translocating NADH-quinone reductase subunit B [Chlamydiia bacterium]|nr:Na(+)-translocating NADH-quinone reductase subunit B [Chlamydiia bacterium]MCH9615025.1 Na(+)-translocating NADH-quinone reductase subunit B [Chlamydiia bacterium]MCH9629924.1 Na(+)-translocating NADH-quinone reductase subunit B [Chlamydiia bacterium]